MEVKKVVVAGGGVLGSQIAFQTAFKGFDTTFWLRGEDSITRTKPKVDVLYKIYLDTLDSLKPLMGNPKAIYPRGLVENFAELTVEKIEKLKSNVETAYKNLKYVIDLKEAVKDADVIIESVAEIPDAKAKFYEELSKYLPEKTIIATNTSTLLPSMFMEKTGRPEKYLALHFANSIWKNNIGEVMRTEKTSDEAFETIFKFASQIGMIPLKVNKEQPGYLLNSLLVPFLSAAEALLAKEVSDPETIDKAWMIGTGAPVGPFRILDIVGLETAYNIARMKPSANDPESIDYKIVEMLKKYIDEGKTGVNSGEGFYKYI